ncbi:acyl carrier protein [bacterium BMS3Abin06]|nr:acyl carrier protein [bacterium BMS3Abin06]HDZ01831.1 acyl carrier protein [Nitrospirota bacterium]
MSVETRVKDIIAKELGVDVEKVTPEASFADTLGADSPDTVELIMTFEEEFNIEIPDKDRKKILKVQDVVKYVEEKSGT